MLEKTAFFSQCGNLWNILGNTEEGRIHDKFHLKNYICQKLLEWQEIRKSLYMKGLR